MTSPFGKKTAPPMEPERQNLIMLRAVRMIVISLGVTLALLITALTFTLMDLHNTQALLINGRSAAAKNAEEAAKSAVVINKIVNRVEGQLLQLKTYGGDVTTQLCVIEQNWLSYAKLSHITVIEPVNVKAICASPFAAGSPRTS